MLFKKNKVAYKTGEYTPGVCQVCGAHPIKLIVTWLFPDRAIKGKITKKLERQLWTSHWFSDPNSIIFPFQLAWFSWRFDASLVSRLVFRCGNPGCALIQPHTFACNHSLLMPPSGSFNSKFFKCFSSLVSGSVKLKTIR